MTFHRERGQGSTTADADDNINKRKGRSVVRVNHGTFGITPVGFYFDCWVLLRLLGFTSIVGFCVDCWDLFKLWKFCIILVKLENKFSIGKYIAECTLKRQMIYHNNLIIALLCILLQLLG